MSDLLFITLIYLVVYGLIGIIPLSMAGIANTKMEKLFSGLFLIYYASFMLTMFAVATGAIGRISSEEVKQLTDLTEFNQYILLLGFIYTFLFGGVGTNIVTSALSPSDNKEVLAALDRLEQKVETMSGMPEEGKSTIHKAVISLSVLVFAISLVLVVKVLS